jgi:hypothetical protein|tara:strand:+ start:1402 stop:1815 length:414 start_codon:yes stop_codon:yes gene_type:complete
MRTKPAQKKEKIERVLELMKEGYSLRKACIEADCSRQGFSNWIDESDELIGRYARAREMMIDFIADETLTIADEDLIATGEGKVDSAMVQKQRLRVDTRKWLLSKLAPKKYGDKLELSGDDKAPISIQRIERVIIKE